MKTVFLGFSIKNSSLTDYFVTLSNRLAEKYRVVIITDMLVEHPFEISPKIHVYRWPSIRPTKARDFFFLCGKVIRYRPVTMISMFGAVNLFLLTGLIFRVKNRIAWARSVMTAFAPVPHLHRRKKHFYRMATHLFANSNATRKDLIDTFDVPDSKIRINYNAVRVGQIPINTDRNKLIFVGRLHDSKGISTLIDAMPEVLKRFPDTHLTIIGGFLEGNAIKKYVEQVARLDIGKSVQFTGWLSKQDVLMQLSQTYVTIVPSFFEAFGFVVIESFSIRTPVIGANTSGIAEILRDGTDGFLFDPGNHADLAQKIIHLLSDPQLREEFSRNCYQHFLDNFEIENATEKVFGQISAIS